MNIKYYKVGGCVRDQIMGIPSKDIDYSVEAPSYEAMRDDIIAKGGKIYLETPQYTTIRAKFLGDDADFVLCRKDGQYKDGRRPESVSIGTLYDDLARRDFTMNAIAIDENGEMIDPFNGVEDIQVGIIRCVGSVDRLYEDSLRMIRAIRFCITKNMAMDIDIMDILETKYHLLENLPVERIRDELYKMFDCNTIETMNILNTYSGIRDQIFKRNIQLVPTITSVKNA